MNSWAICEGEKKKPNILSWRNNADVQHTACDVYSVISVFLKMQLPQVISAGKFMHDAQERAARRFARF